MSAILTALVARLVTPMLGLVPLSLALFVCTRILGGSGTLNQMTYSLALFVVPFEALSLVGYQLVRFGIPMLTGYRIYNGLTLVYEMILLYYCARGSGRMTVLGAIVLVILMSIIYPGLFFTFLRRWRYPVPSFRVFYLGIRRQDHFAEET